MKLNTEFFKRESTWLNIGVGVISSALQLFTDIPDNLTGPLWGYIALSLLMGAIQGVKRSV